MHNDLIGDDIKEGTKEKKNVISNSGRSKIDSGFVKFRGDIYILVIHKNLITSKYVLNNSQLKILASSFQALDTKGKRNVCARFIFMCT